MSAVQSPLFTGIVHRTRITGQLRCETALRIGAGKNSLDAMATNLPVMKDGSGQPYLPGSSLKGVIRAQVEAILRSQAESKGQPPLRWACDPVSQTERCIKDDEDDRKSGAEKLRPVKDRASDARRRVEASACLACRIFGAQSLGSHVLFSDARLSADQPDVRTEIRDSVALDRDLCRAAYKRKYDFEVVPAGTLFELRLLVMDLPEELEGALVLGIQMLEEGFARLGGFRSRGLGLVRLENMKAARHTIVGGRLTQSPDQQWEQYKESRGVAFGRLEPHHA